MRCPIRGESQRHHPSTQDVHSASWPTHAGNGRRYSVLRQTLIWLLIFSVPRFQGVDHLVGEEVSTCPSNTPEHEAPSAMSTNPSPSLPLPPNGPVEVRTMIDGTSFASADAKWSDVSFRGAPRSVATFRSIRIVGSVWARRCEDK